MTATDDLRAQAFGETPVVCPFFPIHLRIIPVEPTGRRDPKRKEKAEWFDLWRREMLLFREHLIGGFDPQTKSWKTGACHELTPDGQKLRRATRNASFRDPVFFLAVFCFVFEPRQSVRDNAMRAGLNPFIPFTVQTRLIRRLQWNLTQEGETADILISKSRDMGATWVVAMFMLWGFLFMDPFVGKIVSRSEGEVDKTNQIDAVMVRIIENLDKIHEYTPWVLPPAFDPKRNRREMLIFRDDNLNNLHGEATQAGTTGRGGRATMAMVDEAAAIRGFAEIWATLVNTTDHRVALSTESNKFGEDFHDAQLQDGAQVFVMEWWSHPWHDEQWYASTRERMKDDARFAREVLRDPFAGDAEFVYPQVKEMGIEPGHFPWPADGKQRGWTLYASVDPGNDDETCFHWIARDPASGRYRLIETYTNAHQPPEFYASIFLGVEDDKFHYTEVDREQMLWCRKHPLPDEIFGDPAGANKTVDDDHSKTWYGRFELYLVGRGNSLRQERWGQIQARRRPVGGGVVDAPTKLAVYRKGVIYRTKEDSRYITGRRAAMQTLFHDLDFNDTPRVRATHRALLELKFEQPAGNKPPVNERSNYSHTWRAHRAASLEYFAVNVADRMTVRRKGRTLRKGKLAA